jgi:hypothetical protein
MTKAHPKKTRSRPDKKSLVSVDAAVTTGAAALVFVNPVAGVVAAGASPVVTAQVKAGIKWLSARCHNRVEYVLAWAARLASLDPKELVARCEQDPAAEQLLLRVVEASTNTVVPEKLVAFALALVSGTSSTSDISWETTFVRVLDDVDQPHLSLLDRFTLPANRTGLGDGPEFDRVPDGLSPTQVAIVGAGLPNLPSLVAGLQRNGLITLDARGDGAWTITEFGHAMLDRLRRVGEMLGPRDPATGEKPTDDQQK